MEIRASSKMGRLDGLVCSGQRISEQRNWFKALITYDKKLIKGGFKMLCCEASSKGDTSKIFYAKHKFVEFGRIKNYWEDGGDLILLVKYIQKGDS